MTAPSPQTRRIEVVGGVTLHCLQWAAETGVGASPGAPFVLVHGLASNCRTWEAVAGRLAAGGHPVTAIDQRGHGLSDAPDAGYDFASLCDDLEIVLNTLGYERAVVVGQSTGGNIAVEFARLTPDRLAGVAGVDGGSLELQDRWPRWEDCATALAPPPLLGMAAADLEALVRGGHPDWSDWGIEVTMANLEVLPDGTVRPWLRRENHMLILRALWQHRPSVVFPKVRVPVMLILADSDDDWSPAKRASAEQAASALERGRVHWVSPADHDIHIQKPDHVAQLLLDGITDGFFA